jgi:GNAT superfamily N-acetyltransferase
MKFLKDYKTNNLYRQSFNKLSNKIFGIDFKKWYELGLWKDNYICYSYFEKDLMVSNVSVCKMDLLFNNKRFKGLQIGTVMTEKSYRNKGLATKLINYVLNEYKDFYDVIFLFTYKNKQNFYCDFGFRETENFFYSLNSYILSLNDKKHRNLCLKNKEDYKLLVNMINNKKKEVQLFYIDNCENIFLWHMINIFSKDIFYIDELDVIIIFRKNDFEIDIFYIIYKIYVPLKTILSYIINENIKTIKLHFTPENLDELDFELKKYSDDESVFLMKSKNQLLNEKVCFPFVFRT